MIGDAHMSPSVLADLWKEEQERIKTLEEKMKMLVREKQVIQLLWTKCCHVLRNFL